MRRVKIWNLTHCLASGIEDCMKSVEGLCKTFLNPQNLESTSQRHGLNQETFEAVKWERLYELLELVHNIHEDVIKASQQYPRKTESIDEEKVEQLFRNEIFEKMSNVLHKM